MTSRLSSVERYDPEKNEWTLVAPMSVCRSTTGVGVIGGKSRDISHVLFCRISLDIWT